MSYTIDVLESIGDTISDIKTNINTSKIYEVLTEIVNVIETTNVSLMSIADSLNRINSKYVR